MANGVIETTTGNLLRAGFTTFVAGAGETLRADVPEPFYVVGDSQYHNWNGVTWSIISGFVPQLNESKLRYQLALDQTIEVAQDVEAIEFDFDKRDGDNALLIKVNVTAGSFGIRFNAEGSDRQVLAAETLVDITDLSVGNHKLKIAGRSAPTNTLDFLEVITAR